MRLVAGGGAVTELLLARRCGEGAERPGALWQRSIGKKLLAGASRRAQVVFTSTSCADSALWCPARVQSEESPPPVYL